MPQEELPKLFTRFYRGDPSRTNPQEGSGLGLAIAKHIVNYHGGTITARSNEGLEINHYEAAIFSDGKSGLAAALNGDFDLILLDLMLPGADGFEICRTVRSRKDIPILMVTAKKEDIDKIQLADAPQNFGIKSP